MPGAAFPRGRLRERGRSGRLGNSSSSRRRCGGAETRRFGVVAIGLLTHGSALHVEEPASFVNVLTGTAGGAQGGQHHSTGNVLPLAAMPWGFNHWSPQSSSERTSWWFDANSDTFHGVRCTHQPSPWIGDYGWFLLRPHFGQPEHSWLGFTSFFAPGVVRPWLIDITAGPRGVRMELAPSDHGAVVRVSYPGSVPPSDRMLCVYIPFGNYQDGDESLARKTGRPSASCQMEPHGIRVESRRYSGGMPPGDSFTHYSWLEFAEEGDLEVQTTEELPPCFEQGFQYTPLDMPGKGRSQVANVEACQKRCADTLGCTHFSFWGDGGCHISDDSSIRKKQAGPISGPARCPGPPVTRQCCFLLGERSSLEVRIGTSLISHAQAARALDEEVRGLSLEDVAAAARAKWNEELSKIEVQDAGPPTPSVFRALETFYTSLYRALLFPRRLDENTPEGVRHWSPYDGKVHAGPGVTDNGFWDTFRTVYPMLSLAYPSRLGEIIEGWLNAFREGGWLPKWASPGYRDSMVGTFGDVVIADAVMKNISGFSHEAAWEALRKDSYESSAPKDTSRGKFGLSHYRDRGYIPIDVKIGEACSRTLDFAFADAAVANVARRLGKQDDAVELLARSQKALSSLYDSRTGLMGRKRASGWFKDEAAETWGDCFTEGAAWHHSFPPFDLPTLAKLHGGEAKLLAKLRELFTSPSTYKVGTYKVEIHEMREMRMLGLGQYAHNNQPVHHLPFLFALLGDPNTTAHLVRRILTMAYSSHGFAGDEDNGEMGSWYVLSSLGLYATAPGVSEDYVLASMPQFPRVHLKELDLVIEAPSADEASPVFAQVLWRSRPWVGATIPYSALTRGGALRFLSTPADLAADSPPASLRGAAADAATGAAADAAGAVAGGAERAARAVPRPLTRSGTVEEDLGLRPGGDPAARARFGRESVPWVLGCVGAVGLLLLGWSAALRRLRSAPSPKPD